MLGKSVIVDPFGFKFRLVGAFFNPGYRHLSKLHSFRHIRSENLTIIYPSAYIFCFSIHFSVALYLFVEIDRRATFEFNCLVVDLVFFVTQVNCENVLGFKSSAVKLYDIVIEGGEGQIYYFKSTNKSNTN